MILAGVFGGMGFLMILLIIFFIALLPIIAIIDLIRNDTDSTNKLIWVIVILFLPILGSILYFLMGRNQRPPRRY